MKIYNFLMENDEFTLRTGELEVSHGHKLWYMEWGKKDAEIPIFLLHGGPGSQSKDSSKTTFNPGVHRVVFFDQRGCGMSTPEADIENNTTQLLIEDIDALRSHLGFEQIMLNGGSWGSTLALAYAIKHPDRVKKMLLNGIFLGMKAEAEYMRQGHIKTHFPEAWEQYDQLVPAESKDDTISYYFDKFLHAKGQELEEHVKRWTLLESVASSIDGDYLKEELTADGSDEKNQQMAKLEAFYFVNNCFLPDSYILDNVAALKDIPIILVQGRHDHVCLPENAYDLARKLGSNCHLHITPGSHKKELALREVVRAYAWAFLV